MCNSSCGVQYITMHREGPPTPDPPGPEFSKGNGEAESVASFVVIFRSIKFENADGWLLEIALVTKVAKGSGIKSEGRALAN
ncbi:hypothetical protein DWB84_17505 [Saccharophagus sp. K07]|nr:hypothetical protein [Saccharophagus sp. K07]